MGVLGSFINAFGIAGTSGVGRKSGCFGSCGVCAFVSPVWTDEVRQRAMISTGSQRATSELLRKGGRRKSHACYADSGQEESGYLGVVHTRPSWLMWTVTPSNPSAVI